MARSNAPTHVPGQPLLKLVATAQGNRRPMASEPTSESSQSFGPFHMARAALPGREMATEAGQVSKNPRRYVVSCSNGSAKLTSPTLLGSWSLPCSSHGQWLALAIAATCRTKESSVSRICFSSSCFLIRRPAVNWSSWTSFQHCPRESSCRKTFRSPNFVNTSASCARPFTQRKVVLTRRASCTAN